MKEIEVERGGEEGGVRNRWIERKIKRKIKREIEREEEWEVERGILIIFWNILLMPLISTMKFIMIFIFDLLHLMACKQPYL